MGAWFSGLGVAISEPSSRLSGSRPTIEWIGSKRRVQIISGLLRDGRADLEGSHYQAHDLELDLPRTRPGGPPILIGASQPRMMALTARYGDMWNAWLPFSNDPIGDVRELNRNLDRACEQEDRDPATLGRTASVAVGVLGRTVRYGPHAMVNLGDSTGELIEKLAALENEGIEHVQICLAPATPEGIEALAPVLEKLH